MKKTVSGLIMEHFIRYDSQDLYIGPVLDTVGKEFFKIHGRRPYDSIKVFQKLVEEGKLTMVSEGVYRYDPDINVHHED